MIYAINKADKTKEPTRKVTVDFFKNKIGLTDDEIIFVDLNEFDIVDPEYNQDEVIDELGLRLSQEESQTFGLYDSFWYIETNFNAEVMNNFARPIFEDQQHGIFKQVFNIFICECGYKETAESSYLDSD